MFPAVLKVIVSEVEDTPAEVVAKNPGPALLAAREAVVGGQGLRGSDPHFLCHLVGNILMYIECTNGSPWFTIVPLVFPSENP